MLTFAAVNWQNYLGRGVEYTNKLYDMVTRNLKEGTEGRFVVFTDDASQTGYHPSIELVEWEDFGLEGWYNKLRLFRNDCGLNIGDRVVFMDLDTLITGPLDEIVAYDGPLAILRDWYRPAGFGSAWMMWEHGKYQHIWNSFELARYPVLAHGDQEWIERAEPKAKILQSKFPDLFCSFKLDARFGVPPKCSVVIFHGHPRPHEASGWVEKLWKVGAGTQAQLELVGNADADIVRGNIERCENDPNAIWLKPVDVHDQVAIICAGGPSLLDEISSIKAHSARGAHIFMCNGVPHKLREFGIVADFHVILDARPENAVFLRGVKSNAVCLYASQCDRAVHDEAPGNLVLWHAAFPGVLDIVGHDKERTYIGGGTTCGMKAATLAWTLGYRDIHLYGFDSCYRDGEHHAYPQSLNDNEQILDVEFNGKSFKCAPWMIQQAEDFESFGPQLMDHGARLYVHGTGLIPEIATQFAKGIFRPESADFRARAILERLKGVESPNVAEIGVFAGDLSRRLLARRSDLHLTMIDKWDDVSSPEFMETGDFHSGLTKEQQESCYNLTQTVTEFAADRRHIIRADSKKAARLVPDNWLDLVFIDADHSYEGCKSDIEAYWDKVRPGGIIGGHDYANDRWRFGDEVKRAVDEFIQAKSLALELGENYTWFAVKPEVTNV